MYLHVYNYIYMYLHVNVIIIFTCIIVFTCFYIQLYSPSSPPYVYLHVSVRAGSVLELDVRLISVSFHKEFRKETGKHDQLVILKKNFNLKSLVDERIPLANAIGVQPVVIVSV